MFFLRERKSAEVQARRFHPRLVALGTDAPLDLPPGCVQIGGPGALEALATDPGVDLVVVATGGVVSLRPVLAALRAGKIVATAQASNGSLANVLPEQAGIWVYPNPHLYPEMVAGREAFRSPERRAALRAAVGGKRHLTGFAQRRQVAKRSPGDVGGGSTRVSIGLD